jgi:hypothetical protein
MSNPMPPPDATIPADNQSGYFLFRISGIAIRLIAEATATLDPEIALNITHVDTVAKPKPPLIQLTSDSAN